MAAGALALPQVAECGLSYRVISDLLVLETARLLQNENADFVVYSPPWAAKPAREVRSACPLHPCPSIPRRSRTHLLTCACLQRIDGGAVPPMYTLLPFPTLNAFELATLGFKPIPDLDGARADTARADAARFRARAPGG